MKYKIKIKKVGSFKHGDEPSGYIKAGNFSAS
jgi:hypothetical protein